MGMVVRSNIMALNANRQLGMNNSSVSKNLEKLSSGFRINRAGDDASGLAISEKMKAQIKGLETASMNSQDGISLVQTAEGALTEVHDMLNRMVELAEKSANGTMEIGTGYGDAGTDRQALQDEMDQLSTEIDRIADSTNFNNIKLLDGKLGVGSNTFSISSSDKGSAVAAVNSSLTKTVNGTSVTFTSGDEVDGLKIQITTSGTASQQDKAAYASGTLKLTLKSGQNYTAAQLNQMIAAATGNPPANAAGSSFSFDGTVAADDLKTSGAAGFGTATATTGGAAATTAANGITKLDFTGKTAADLDKVKFTYGDKTYTLAGTADTAAALAGEANVIDISAAADADAIAAAVAAGLTAVQSDGVTNDTIAATGSVVSITAGTATDSAPDVKLSGGLRLQIGDTSQKFNQMTVSVDDMHMKALFDKDAITDAETGNAALQTLADGTTTLDISDQDSAGAALTAVKKVINKVSSQRASLGAIQNRLEHTINNLDVAAENMNAANSRIRDTDMAKQMMEYTKMNVLTQAAQAMLAQANQQPQSILQLLQ